MADGTLPLVTYRNLLTFLGSEITTSLHRKYTNEDPREQRYTNRKRVQSVAYPISTIIIIVVFLFLGEEYCKHKFSFFTYSRSALWATTDSSAAASSFSSSPASCRSDSTVKTSCSLLKKCTLSSCSCRER